jgi:hypothetical protein
VAREAVSILNGKHTHWVGRGQPEECAERFLQQVGRSHAYASVFADDLASNSESFAELLALESPRVVWMADQVRAGIEHARGIAQARAARRQQVQA